MAGPLILSNRLRAMQEAAMGFGDTIAGLRDSKRLNARQDAQDKMTAESHAASMKQAGNQDLLQGFALRQAGQQEQDASSLRSDQNELAAVDSGLPSFGPRLPADETPSPFLDQNRNLHARLMASIESKQTGKPVSRDDILARKDAQKQKLMDDDYSRTAGRAKDEADLAGTKADTAYKAANTKKLKAEIEAIGKGGVDPEKIATIEGKLRGEYINQNKVFMDVRDAWSRINASEDNAAGDLSLIFNYMKMLDPGSTVREGEFATAQNATGIPERVLNSYNNALAGTRLAPAQRTQFKGQASKLYSSQKDIYSNNVKTYMALALDYGANPGRVAVDLDGGVKGPEQGAASAGSGPKSISTKEEWAALPSGTSYIGPDGKRATKK